MDLTTRKSLVTSTRAVSMGCRGKGQNSDDWMGETEMETEWIMYACVWVCVRVYVCECGSLQYDGKGFGIGYSHKCRRERDF